MTKLRSKAQRIKYIKDVSLGVGHALKFVNLNDFTSRVSIMRLALLLLVVIVAIDCVGRVNHSSNVTELNSEMKGKRMVPREEMNFVVCELKLTQDIYSWRSNTSWER